MCWEKMSSNKPHLNMIVMGHVDHGKSTLTGHLLFDSGYIDQKTIDSYAKESEKTGAGDTFKFAWVLDTIKEERERGVTIDLSFQKFETSKNFYTIIDAPGHRDFIKNMITGASQADVAILVVSGKKGEFEVAVGPGGQAREHAYLARTLGVKNLIVAINKMDDPIVKFDEERYKECRKELEGLLKTVGFDISKINFIPTSGWKGDNLVKKSNNTPWYKGARVLEARDMFSPPTIAREFIGQIIIIYHPTAIANGYTPVLHAHTATVGVTFEEIIRKIDPRTGQIVEEKPAFIKVGDSALVKMKPLRPMVLENFADIPELGRFAIRDMGATVGVGVVKEVTVKGHGEEKKA